VPEAMAQRRCGRPTGFSLIELLLVLSIVLVAAAIAAPRYASATARYRSELVARRVVAELTLARARAQHTGRSVAVTLDAADGRLAIVGIDPLDPNLASYTVALGDEPYRATVLSADFGGDDTVRFDGYGEPDSGGLVRLTVGGVMTRVVLEAQSGKAVIQ